MRALILTALLAAPVQAQTPQCMGLPDALSHEFVRPVSGDGSATSPGWANTIPVGVNTATLPQASAARMARCMVACEMVARAVIFA